MSGTTTINDMGYRYGEWATHDEIGDTWDFSFPSNPYLMPGLRTKNGISLPDYKRRIAAGQSATTPFTASESSYNSIYAIEQVFGSTVSYYNPSAWRTASARWSHGISIIPSLPSDSDNLEATNIASTRFYRALEQTMTAFQGGVFLAELRETLHMIRNPAQGLREGVDRYMHHLGSNRGRMMRRPPATRSKFLADSWLEYSFGWAPLLNDLNDARNVLKKRQNQLVQELIPVIGVGRAQQVVFEFTGFFVGPVGLRSEVRHSSDTLRVYAGKVSSRASGTNLLTASALGLSPRSFVPTLWEVLPWSFAIDYFTNVGDVLQAWSNQTVGLAWGRDTSVRKSISESTNTDALSAKSPLPYVYKRFVYGGKTKAVRRSVARNPITYVPIPALQYELPGFGRKWLNIAALVDGRRNLTFR